MIQFSKLARSFISLVDRNSPMLLTAVGVGGVITTAVLAAKGHQKALKNMEVLNSEATLLNKVEVTWKDYLPAVISGGVTIACVVGAQSINARRTAAILSLYAASESALKNISSEVIEEVGEKKFQVIKDKVGQKLIDDNLVSKSEEIYITGTGNTLCYDSLSGRYFKSSVEAIKKAQNDLNYGLINGAWSNLNVFYRYLGLPSIDLGDNVGWVPEALLEVKLGAMLAEGETPCILLEYFVAPSPNKYCL